MERRQLNDIYEKLDKKAREICKRLHCDFGYFNNHYHKNASGQYEIDHFPIPVVSLKGRCDIEIDINQISVTTKLTREKAISSNYDQVMAYDFEAYGVNNYLDDFYLAGDTTNDMIEKIKRSKEETVFFSFYFPFDVAPSVVYEFVNFIGEKGFFY